MKTKHIALQAIVAIAITTWLFASTDDDGLLKDVGRIASFSAHAKMIKNGEIEKATQSLEGLMKQGYIELRHKYPDSQELKAAKRSILDYYTSTNQSIPDYLMQ
jgi:hypothetical protein